jgi:uncharacterized protein YlzI (FlbEa/FlbD family)
LLPRVDGFPRVQRAGWIVDASAIDPPDTVITLAPGQRLLVKESLDEVMERIRANGVTTPTGGSRG